MEELIDWSNVPDDPIYQLTFPQPGMLNRGHLRRITAALDEKLAPKQLRHVVNAIRQELNPHPDGQLGHNVPRLDDTPVAGVQHKYRETCLVFPSAGQTCHAYCTFCFRWPQFVGMPELKLATDESKRYCEYVRRHPEISDVLLTGGDPLVMRTEVLARYIEPLLGEEFEHVRTIRFGTKSLAYWPYRYLSDKDADDLMRLLERIVKSGRHLAIMAHFNHWRELETPSVARAIQRLRAVGAVIRVQSPLVRHINDDSHVWSQMWEKSVALGCVPYYLFIERDTGASCYFRVPICRALEIYREAMARVSGLARTARGPVMSALPGKVVVEGETTLGGQRLFVLSFLQARDPAWCKQPFFAQFDGDANWLSDLRPAFGEKEFFYDAPLRERLARGATEAASDQMRTGNRIPPPRPVLSTSA